MGDEHRIMRARQHSPAAEPEGDETVRALAGKARSLYESREMLCAEAVLTALNQGLGGGLDPEQARGLAMGSGYGMGGSGCVCGALTGAVLAVSLFLSKALPPDQVRQAAAEAHQRFMAGHGSTCCRVLTKPVKADPAKHFAHCADLTEQAAAMAAGIILSRLPELGAGLDRKALSRRRSRLSTLLRRLADTIG
jgi:C_GCAxxG_C_C family probable redox protein